MPKLKVRYLAGRRVNARDSRPRIRIGQPGSRSRREALHSGLVTNDTVRLTRSFRDEDERDALVDAAEELLLDRMGQPRTLRGMFGGWLASMGRGRL
jgi:hypothetical protein